MSIKSLSFGPSKEKNRKKKERIEKEIAQSRNSNIVRSCYSQIIKEENLAKNTGLKRC